MIVPAFTLFDAASDYETGGWRFALNVQNLEDEHYVAACWNACYYGTGRTIIGTVKHRCEPGPEAFASICCCLRPNHTPKLNSD